MKLNVSEEITSMDLKGKTIASLQTNMSPGRYTGFNFENCSA